MHCLHGCGRNAASVGATMTSVFVLERCFDYEGSTLLGVYSSREKAKAAEAADEKNGAYCDYYNIEEFVIDGDYDD